MKKQYFLVIDVETANSTDDALVYDLGLAVTDRQGNIYETASMVISDIFTDEVQLMNSAYYAEKIPSYHKGIQNHEFEITNFYQARRFVISIMEKYGIDTVAAYNAHFDSTALNTTQRWLTKSKYRYFFPYGTKIICIWHMACQVICTQKRYYKFCQNNDFVSPSGNIKTSAETVYAYMTKDVNFDESHTGLADVLIECQIMAKCFAQHKKMDKSINRLCWRIPQNRQKRGIFPFLFF